MTFCPSSLLRLDLALETGTAREGALGDLNCRNANSNFRAILMGAQPQSGPYLTRRRQFGWAGACPLSEKLSFRILRLQRV
jgi:hypothetical protein